MAATQRRDKMGKALVRSSGQNDLKEMRKQLRKGADVEYLLRLNDEEGEEKSLTPLLSACGDGHMSAVTLLIENGADVNKQEPCQGLAPLHALAEGGHVSVMKLLISKGARVDVRDKDGMTPLHSAAVNRINEAAVFLLDHGADINAADMEGYTPLMMAVAGKSLSLVDLFLLRGADPNLRETADGQTALHGSLLQGLIDIAEHLVEGGADVNQVDKLGASPLLMAAQDGHLKIVKLLVKKGADIHQVSSHGLSALHSASFFKHKEVVDYLIKKGADFDDQGNAVGKACKCCGATDIPVFKCAGCKVVWYCSPECQKKDWKEGGENKHKIQCPRIKEQRELYKEKKKEETKKEAAEIDKRWKSEKVREVLENSLTRGESRDVWEEESAGERERKVMEAFNRVLGGLPSL